MLQIPELLAPAGDLERLRYAINYGADAVYCGLPEFGMRSAPANFTPEQLAEGVIYAHARGRKVYLTMNTLPTNEEAKDAYFFVTDLKGNYYYARTLSEHNANCQTAADVNKTVK